MLGLFEGTIDAFLDISWSFHKRVLVGDTLSGKIVITDKEAIESSNCGRVVVDVYIYNQRDELMSTGRKSYRILCQPH